MNLSENKAVRLGIYFFYDNDGIVDDFVTYFLNDLIKSLDRLIVVCNGKLTTEGEAIFRQITKDVLVRENSGLDVWAYKTALEYVGWENCRTYDEIVLCNSTSMGPVYPFEEMFAEMDKRDIDFWGITKTHEVPDFDFGYNPYGYLPEHIQSNFIVYRKRLIGSSELRQYWDTMPEITSYEQSIGLYESAFTKIFADKGFKWDVYVNTDAYEGVVDQPLMFYAAKLIAKQRCPIFKRRTFFHKYDDTLMHTVGQPALLLYDYLVENNLYDVNMIWQNILRCYNLVDISRQLHLNYTLSSKFSDKEILKVALKREKIALVMHLYFEDMLLESLTIAKSIPPEADVYITTNSAEKKEKIEAVFESLKCNKLEVKVIKNRGRDVAALLVGMRETLKDYSLVCFSHDKKTTQSNPGSVGESFAYQCYANILYNKRYVENIITLFYESERLGLIVPPAPNHGEYHLLRDEDWNSNFEGTKKLCESLGVNISIDKNIKPIAPYGSVFWFRPKAMKLLLEREWKYEEFPEEPLPVDGTISHAIERSYAFCAQQEGYYSAIAMSDHFARIQYTNQDYYLKNDNTIDNLKTQLNQVYESTSWKLSKPVRIFGEGLKKLK